MSGQQIVVFDVQEFLSRYPEFDGKFTDEQLENFFNIAEGILSNTGFTPVCDYDLLKTMLYLLTAHVAFFVRPRSRNGRQPVLGKRGSGFGFVFGATKPTGAMV